MKGQSAQQMGTIIKNAVVFNIRNWNGGRSPMSANSLLDAVDALFALLDERSVMNWPIALAKAI